MVSIGSQAEREVEDYHLSRYACYLIAQNGDPRKPEIAQAQKYFAIQTRRQEISDQMAADLERLEIREQTTVEFKALSGAARDAGVQDKMFGIFHDAGYKRLYGGFGVDAIKFFRTTESHWLFEVAPVDFSAVGNLQNGFALGVRMGGEKLKRFID